MFNITELLKDEISVWERLKNCGKPVVLYGMGDGADKVLAAFDRYGIKRLPLLQVMILCVGRNSTISR
mgnify:CR=1 FL=1